MSPPLTHRQVFDVVPGSSGAAVQAAIDAAVTVNGIVHLPVDYYNVFQTLEIPLNVNISILGDGGFTDIVANSSLQGPALRSYSKNIQLENIRFSSYSKVPPDALIELHVPDTPSTCIFCDECAIDDQITTAVEWDGLDDASLEFRVPTINGPPAATIHGGLGRQNGHQTLGNIGAFLSSTSAYAVDLGGHLLSEDGFHDTGQRNTQFVLTGDGSLTQMGGASEASSGPNPAMMLNNYKGQLSLLGVATNSFVQINPGSPSTVVASGNIQESGVSPVLSLEPRAIFVGVDNSANTNKATPTTLPDTATTPAHIEHMMSMARTQILTSRLPFTVDSTTIRMTRLYVEFNGVGLRVVNDTPSSIDGNYSISSTDGQSSLPQASCGPGEVTMAGTWTLQDGGGWLFRNIECRSHLVRN